jgi:beta-glucanase (GH16 family)
VGGATYYLHNACGGRVLDVTGVSTADGALVQIWDKSGGANQQWTIAPQSDGSYQLTSANSGKVLDVKDRGTTNGTRVQQWTASGGTNQHWNITDVGGGYAKLNPVSAPSKALDVAGAGTANGTAVQIYDDNGSCAQRWQLEPRDGSTAPPPPTTQWVLTWQDEFDGPAGGAVDPNHWTNEVGGGGWGNNELEYYTAGAHNASLDGAGHLVIEARRESTGGNAYTSARLKTAGHFAQAYGRFEARIKAPTGSGIWPAFWMLGDNIGTVGWPTSGEIDVMEIVGPKPSTVYGTGHAGGSGGHWSGGGSFTLSSGVFSDDYHVFAAEWTPDAIRWYVDGALYYTLNKSSLAAGQAWNFDHPFFLLLNVAVGGNWPGAPAADAVFPQRMYVDYVRVYRAGP